MIVITQNSIDYIDKYNYKYFLINNVIHSIYENFNSIHIYNSEQNTNSNNCYLMLNFPFSNALFHWIAECCVYFELFHKLKKEYPSLKMVFLVKRDYHRPASSDPTILMA